jgi:hypothetical protein
MISPRDYILDYLFLNITLVREIITSRIKGQW